jgi:hypothetical protein
MSSAPVSSEVSPNMTVAPMSTSLSTATPSAGFEASPDVVSDSPHFIEAVKAETSTSVLCLSLASWTILAALRDAISMALRSPRPSMDIASTGLPVLAIMSAILLDQESSIPTTMAAATFGFEPVPANMWKRSCRSRPNWSLP